MPSYRNHYEVLDDVEYAATHIDDLAALQDELTGILSDARHSGLMPDRHAGWSKYDDAYDSHVQSLIRSKLRRLRDQPGLWNIPLAHGVAIDGEE